MDTTSIPLKCGVCGNIDFKYDDTLYKSITEAKDLTCSVCNKIYTREELIDCNTSLINNTSEELAIELVEKELKKFKFEFKRK